MRSRGRTGRGGTVELSLMLGQKQGWCIQPSVCGGRVRMGNQRRSVLPHHEL